MTEKRTVWVAYTNTDCTEGRGHDVPIAVCAAEATALRLARRQYVRGSDGPVRTMELVKIDGKWYAPSAALTIVEPTRGGKSEGRRADRCRSVGAGLEGLTSEYTDQQQCKTVTNESTRHNQRRQAD